MNSKLLLPISLSLNLALVAIGAVVLQHSHDRSDVANDSTSKIVPTAPSSEQKVLLSASPEIRSVQWGDLASSDDAVFARNLRGIGCPEATIRDILTAALGRRFDEQRQALQVEHQQGKIDTATFEAAVAQTWEQQNLQANQLPASPSAQLSSPQASAPVTSNVAGNPMATPDAVSGGVGAGSSSVISSRGPVVTPVALTEPAAALGLTDDQKAAAYQIGDRFSNAVSAQNVPPTDPAYHKAWQDAQPDADAALEGMIGGEAFVRWQIQAAAQGSAAPQPSK